jgi:hypothetical protein
MSSSATVLQEGLCLQPRKCATLDRTVELAAMTNEGTKRPIMAAALVIWTLAVIVRAQLVNDAVSLRVNEYESQNRVQQVYEETY